MQIAADHQLQSEILHVVFEHAPVMINILDPAGRVTLVNPYWEEVLGWSLHEARQSDVFDAVYPDPDERRRAAELIAKKSPGWHEFRPRTRHGRIVETAWMLLPLSDGTLIGLGQDFSRRRTPDPAATQAIEGFIQRISFREDPYERLTTRQREVLQLVVEGRRTKEIAKTLNISVKTVEAHRSQLMTALGIHDIPGLVRYAIRTGLISAEN